MKLPKINFKPEAVLTAATLVLGVAQMVLTNKKEATEKSVMKAEIMEEILKDLPTKKD